MIIYFETGDYVTANLDWGITSAIYYWRQGNSKF